MEVLSKNIVESLLFEGNNLIIKVNGKEYHFLLKDISMKLLNASETERINFIISPSGYGIHWPSIDEDISIQAMLRKALH